MHTKLVWPKDGNSIVIPTWIEDQSAWLHGDFNDPYWQKVISKRRIDLKQFNDQNGIGKLTCWEGPLGGGIVTIDYDITEWSPTLVLLIKYREYCPPGQQESGGLRVVVPEIKATHKIGETPIPIAPSPLFSIEYASQSGLLLVITSKRKLPMDAMQKIDLLFRDFGVKHTLCGVGVGECPGLLKWIQERRLHSEWSTVEVAKEFDIREYCARILYAATSLKWDAAEIFSMHLVGAVEGLPDGYISAQKWNRFVRPKRTASEWVY